MDNRRKMGQAMQQMLADDARRGSIEKDHKPDPAINQFLNNSLPTTEATFKPKVLSLTNQSFKLGELSAARTHFQLRANPRIN